MPTTIYRGVMAGDFFGDRTDCPATFYSGELPAGADITVTAAALTASAMRGASTFTITTYGLVNSGDGGGKNAAEQTYHYDYAEPQTWLIDLGLAKTALLSGVASLGMHTGGHHTYHGSGVPARVRMAQGSVWTLTVTWQYDHTACTAPSSLALDAARRMLTILGGTGGVNNAKIGYGLEVRISTDGGGTWGAWTSLGTVGEQTTLAIGGGERRQYRARTLGEAGSAYTSGYTMCPSTLVGNTAPGAVTVTLPASGAASKTVTPRVRLSVPAEPDGQSQTLQRRVDGGGWMDVRQVSSGAAVDVLPTLSGGAHTVSYRLVDSQGAAGAPASLSLTVALPTWGRTLSTGDVISNAAISHRADLLELMQAINACRAYCGLAAQTLAGTLGRFADWQYQVQQMQAALGACYAEMGASAPSWLPVPAAPCNSGAVAALNQLRGAMV